MDCHVAAAPRNDMMNCRIILESHDWLKKMKVLITSGPTREYIDAVRFLSNSSSGRTGAGLAEYFVGINHQVTLVRAKDSAIPKDPCAMLAFETFTDLDSLLQNTLKTTAFDVVIHTAAVSDYSIASVAVNGCEAQLPVGRKIESSHELVVKFKQNFKIVDRIKEYARRSSKFLQLVAFKLTATFDEEERKRAIKKLFDHCGADFVVHNDVNDFGENRDRHFRIYSPTHQIEQCHAIKSLGAALEREFLKAEKRRIA